MVDRVLLLLLMGVKERFACVNEVVMPDKSVDGHESVMHSPLSNLEARLQHDLEKKVGASLCLFFVAISCISKKGICVHRLRKTNSTAKAILEVTISKMIC